MGVAVGVSGPDAGGSGPEVGGVADGGELRRRAVELIAQGRLPVRPSGKQLRAALGCSTEVARRLSCDLSIAQGRALALVASQADGALAAERSVLGAMLLSADAVGEVTATMAAADLYWPVHATIYQAICDLYGNGDPTDPVAVSAELHRRGELTRVGGAPFLHTLIATVPTAANAGYYAEIVADQARLRRLADESSQAHALAARATTGGVARAGAARLAAALVLALSRRSRI